MIPSSALFAAVEGAINPRSLEVETSVIYWIVAILILGFGLVVLWKIWTDQISLNGLISELDDGKTAGGKASLSRFQFLIFTFVIAGLYLVLCLESGTFLDVPNGVLALLGISGGSFVVSKGISGQTPPGGKGSDGGGAGGGGANPAGGKS